MNIKLLYLYRDAGNYKNFGEVVFGNAARLPVELVYSVVRRHLIEESWFAADRWGLPDLHFKEYGWDSALDHGWHELEGIEATDDVATGGEDVAVFLERVKRVGVLG